MMILLAFAVPRFDMSSNYVDKVVNELIADVRYVQMENMKAPSSGYEIKIYSDKYYVRQKMTIEKTVNLKKGCIIKYNNEDTISFTYGGEPKKAGTLTVDYNGKIKKISIVPVTGRTIILE